MVVVGVAAVAMATEVALALAQAVVVEVVVEVAGRQVAVAGREVNSDRLAARPARTGAFC